MRVKVLIVWMRTKLPYLGYLEEKNDVLVVTSMEDEVVDKDIIIFKEELYEKRKFIAMLEASN